jgi:hypothetical protein
VLRVSDAGRSQRCGLHRGRRPKALNEGTRGKLQAAAPRAPSANGGFRPKSWHIDVDEDALDHEMHFLRKEIYQCEADIHCSEITALNRFSNRI